MNIIVGVSVVIMFGHFLITRPLTGPLIMSHSLYSTQNLLILSIRDSMIMTFLDCKTKRAHYKSPLL